MTAIGLAVAVPAVLAYNFLISRNKNAMSQIRAFASDVHGFLIGGKLAGKGRA
jgi:biopolymer transport protein ExbB